MRLFRNFDPVGLLQTQGPSVVDDALVEAQDAQVGE